MKKPPLSVLRLKRDTSHHSEVHSHKEGQLLLIQSGLLVVQTEKGRWVMPSGRAGWIPPDSEHSAQSYGSIKGANIYLQPDLIHPLPKEPLVFTPSLLLREVLTRILTWENHSKWTTTKGHLTLVLGDELASMKPDPLYLPMPCDKRLIKIAHGFIADPASKKTLIGWSKVGNVSARTFTRLFRQETGMSFAQWCQLARVLKALEYLEKKKSVTWVAITLGYQSVSAFIKIFKKYLGRSPTEKGAMLGWRILR